MESNHENGVQSNAAVLVVAGRMRGGDRGVAVVVEVEVVCGGSSLSCSLGWGGGVVWMGVRNGRGYGTGVTHAQIVSVHACIHARGPCVFARLPLWR